MSRLISDQNKIVLLLESGTYTNPSGTGHWPGQVQSHDITESENVILTRYLGASTRDVSQFNNGPLDVEGTLTFFPQDFRLLGYAMGSISTTSGTGQSSNYRHSLSAVNTDVRNPWTSGTFNPFASFTIEESSTSNVASQNSMRTIKGCNVNTYKLDLTQSAPASVTVDFIGQVGSWFSGATTAVTAGSTRPFLWSDAVFQIAPDLAGGAAVTMEPVTSLSFTLNNNFEFPHYINGSRVPAPGYPLNREYIIDVTQNLESTTVGSLYDTYFKGGSLFHCIIDLNNTVNTGSHHLIMTFSGCRITDMTSPGELEGVRELSYTITAGSMSALEHNRLPLLGTFA